MSDRPTVEELIAWLQEECDWWPLCPPGSTREEVRANTDAIVAALLSERIRPEITEEVVERMRAPEATIDDAPAHIDGLSPAAAWKEGFDAAMRQVHTAALSVAPGYSVEDDFTDADVNAMEEVYRFALTAPGRLPERVSHAIEQHHKTAAKVAARVRARLAAGSPSPKEEKP